MADKKLVNYLHEGQKRVYPIENLRASLSSQGISQEKIIEAEKKLQKEKSFSGKKAMLFIAGIVLLFIIGLVVFNVFQSPKEEETLLQPQLEDQPSSTREILG